jgi:uncharacterized membrane protein
MKRGAKYYLFQGIAGLAAFLINLAILLIGQGYWLNILAVIFFLVISVEGFVSYLRIKGKTQFHFIS